MSWIADWVLGWVDGWLGDVVEVPVPPGPEPEPEPVVVHVRGGGRFRPFTKMPWAWPFQEEVLPPPYVLQDKRYLSKISVAVSVESRISRLLAVRRKLLEFAHSVISGTRSAQKVHASTINIAPRIESSIKVAKVRRSFKASNITVYSLKTTKVVDELWLLGLPDDSEEALMVGISEQG